MRDCIELVFLLPLDLNLRFASSKTCLAYYGNAAVGPMADSYLSVGNVASDAALRKLPTFCQIIWRHRYRLNTAKFFLAAALHLLILDMEYWKLGVFRCTRRQSILHVRGPQVARVHRGLGK
jgi:hypothetical protein